MCMNVLPVCVCMMCVPVDYGGQKRALDPQNYSY